MSHGIQLSRLPGLPPGRASRRALFLASACLATAAMLPATPLDLVHGPWISVRAQDSVQFAVIGDYGCDNEAEADVARLVRGWDPGFIVTVGDNNYPQGSAETIDRNVGKYFHDYIGAYDGDFGPGSETNRFFPALGNHDWMSKGARPYLDYFELPGNERYYDFAQGPVHVFVLDSDPSEPDGTDRDSKQARWLKESLASSPETWKVVVFHHAPYSSGVHGSTPGMRWPFGEWGVDLVVSGHDHHYERRRVDGAVYVVNGTGGAGLRTVKRDKRGPGILHDDDHGALRVSGSKAALRVRFVSTEGTVLDDFELSISGELRER